MLNGRAHKVTLITNVTMERNVPQPHACEQQGGQEEQEEEVTLVRGFPRRVTSGLTVGSGLDPEIVLPS
jgi:hypothetical protein